MNSGISCWVAPLAAANITHTINSNVASYFAANHANATEKRAALLSLLERIDGEKGRRLIQRLLFSDKKWPNRIPKLEGYINKTWNVELLKTKDNFVYFSKSCFAVRTLWSYLAPVLLILGSIGNCLSFVVLCQPKMRQTSTYVYLAALAIFDEMVLLSALLPFWLHNVFGWQIETFSKVTCQLMNALGFITSCTSVWIIVVVTIERLLVVRFPLRAGNFTSPRHALTIIGLILLLFFLIATHFFLTTELRNIKLEEQSITFRTCEINSEIGSVVWSIVDGFLYSYLPILGIVTLNVLILLALRRASIRRAALTSQQQLHSTKQLTCDSATVAHTCGAQSKSHSRAEENSNMVQLTRMLILVSGSFVVTTLPVVIVRIVHITNRVQKTKRGSDATFILFDTIADLLMFVNHTINILLYCTKGAKFRSQLKRLLCRISFEGLRDNGTVTDTRTYRSMGVQDNSIPMSTYRSLSLKKDQQNESIQ